MLIAAILIVSALVGIFGPAYLRFLLPAAMVMAAILFATGNLHFNMTA